MARFRRAWVEAVTEAARVNHPEKVHRLPVVLGVARAWADHGDDDGQRVQASTDTAGREAGVSPATAARVRRWLIANGLGHVESGPVKGRKATWWHLALPGVECSRCLTPDPAVGIGRAAALSRSYSQSYSRSPSEGSQPLTTTTLSSERKVGEQVRKTSDYAPAPKPCPHGVLSGRERDPWKGGRRVCDGCEESPAA